MKKTPKKYESAELELGSDRRASVISARYGSVPDLKTAAYAAGKPVWEHNAVLLSICAKYSKTENEAGCLCNTIRQPLNR